jgi:uroporphyrinogen-III synthase
MEKFAPCKILITRPYDTACRLASKIYQLNMNYEPIIFPAVSIEKITGSGKVARIKKYLSALSGYQHMIFISTTAVEKFRGYQQSIPPHLSLYCVGKDTAQALEQYQLGNPVFPLHHYNSESLLQLQALSSNNIKNTRFLLCQGEGGNSLIKKTLVRRGAKVNTLVLYRRALPQLKIYPDLRDVSLIICTNQQSITNLIYLLGNTVKEKQWVVSSEKLAAFLTALGTKYKPLLAKHAADEAILAFLKEYKERINL